MHFSVLLDQGLGKGCAIDTLWEEFIIYTYISHTSWTLICNTAIHTFGLSALLTLVLLQTSCMTVTKSLYLSFVYLRYFYSTHHCFIWVLTIELHSIVHKDFYLTTLSLSFLICKTETTIFIYSGGCCVALFIMFQVFLRSLFGMCAKCFYFIFNKSELCQSFLLCRINWATLEIPNTVTYCAFQYSAESRLIFNHGSLHPKLNQ